MPGFTYETVCPNCGKPLRRELLLENKDRKFCNRACWREYHDKKNAEREKRKAMIHKLSAQLVPPEQCERCRYGCSMGGVQGCGYFDITGHTRTSLHPEGLSGECQEFARKKRGRKPKSMTIKQN